eukprot:scaffold8374_cov175-Amphora_coffeaeformis.AAC.65
MRINGSVSLAFVALFFFGSVVETLQGFASIPNIKQNLATSLYARTEKDSVAQDALERTAAHLKKLQGVVQAPNSDDGPPDPLGVEREKICQRYIQMPANTLKEILKERKLPRYGRKPDLARRLAEDDLRHLYGEPDEYDAGAAVHALLEGVKPSDEMFQNDDSSFTLSKFAGIRLSLVAGEALARANFLKPSPIQAAAIPALVKGESLLLHAETGSGKTLAYLLHMTEALWKGSIEDGRFLVLTPTRELAAQVAGVASVLAPPGSVRMVNHPSNLMTDGQKDRGEGKFGGRVDAVSQTPRLFIGSAKSIMTSLYGDSKTPASPTPKPLAMEFLQSVQCVVLDEVDRLLNVKKSRAEKAYKKHERPAAVLVAALMRLSLGKTQIVAASATVGRPLKRELTRVMGLPPQECPRVVVAASNHEQNDRSAVKTNRAVTIPSGVEHFVIEAEGQSDGKMLTMAYKAIHHLNHKPRRMLLVLSRGFGLNPQNVVSALRHFNCKPNPENLLDRLYAEGTDQLIEAHRHVSGASGVGEKASDEGSQDNTEYLLVTGEDSVRGLHLDGLDLVFVVGKPNGPDEYTHIAGRTGRAGQPGKVINIVGANNGRSLTSWENMLGVQFELLELDDLKAF